MALLFINRINNSININLLLENIELLKQTDDTKYISNIINEIYITKKDEYIIILKYVFANRSTKLISQLHDPITLLTTYLFTNKIEKFIELFEEFYCIYHRYVGTNSLTQFFKITDLVKLVHKKPEIVIDIESRLNSLFITNYLDTVTYLFNNYTLLITNKLGNILYSLIEKAFNIDPINILYLMLVNIRINIITSFILQPELKKYIYYNVDLETIRGLLRTTGLTQIDSIIINLYKFLNIDIISDNPITNKERFTYLFNLYTLDYETRPELIDNNSIRLTKS